MTVFCFVKFTVTCVVTPCSLVAAYQIPPPPPPEQPDYTASGDSNLLRHCNRFTLYFTQSTYHKWHVIRDVPRSGWFSCSALYVNSGATFFESRTGHQISWRFFFFAFFVRSKQIPWYFVDWSTNPSFRILSNLSFACHPTINTV